MWCIGMAICPFSFSYKGRQLCVLEDHCALKSPEEQQTCQKVHEVYDNLTPNEIRNRREFLIYKLEYHPTLKYDNPPSETKQSERSQQIAQSKEKLRGLNIKF